MAVISISRIQVRRGYQEDLPQLASGEMGWSIDTQKLYIGNGTLTEGAPAIGNTEVLTVNSPLAADIDIGILYGNVASIQSNLTSVTSNVSALTVRVTNVEANVALLQDNLLTTSVLSDNVSNPANISQISGSVQYTYNISRVNAVRTGVLKVAELFGVATYEDDFTETEPTGVTLSVASFGANTYLTYTTTSTGVSANLSLFKKVFI